MLKMRRLAIMPIKLRQNWALPESAVTPEHIYMTRRQWLQAAGFAGAGLAALFAGGAPTRRVVPSGLSRTT